MAGVGIGYKHDWNYRIRKYRSKMRGNREHFTEVQSKSRNRRTRSYGSFKRGTKLIWKVVGRFYTRRRNGKWQTVYKMRKRNLKTKLPRKRWR